MRGVGNEARFWSTPISMRHELGASVEDEVDEVDELEMALLGVSADLTRILAAFRLSHRIGASGNNRPGST